jgi:diguanylate cyclase (GGDEF)-like protein
VTGVRPALFCADITDVARLQHLAGRYRPPVALLLAWLSVPTLGVDRALAWIGVVLAAEVWTWICTRPAMTRALTVREMVTYVLSGTVTMPAWAALGTMFWFDGGPDGVGVAMALWVGQLLYTQRFVFQSYLAILMGNAVMVATMAVVPMIHPRTQSSADHALFELGLLFCIGFTISASLAAYARIRALAEQNAAIQRAAVTDELTALPNRSRFTQALDEATAARMEVWLLYMDLDRFKNVNDTLGHQAGDALLRQFAGRLLEVSPPGALVARLGGDEFAALVAEPDFSLEQAEALCRRIVSSVKAPFAIENGQAHVGVSIGLASAASGDLSGADLMRRADIALYSMKANGRAGYTVFNDDLEMAVRSRTEIEEALRATLASGGGLSLAYQPKVDRLGRMNGVEALVRWRMNGRPVSPAIFVPIAEDTGLILALGDWVLGEAIAFALRWPGLSVAVNLSPAQMREVAFGANLLDRIRRAGLEPGRIELEITETALFDSKASTLDVLGELRAAGLHVALDDFGTGYSSLRHLHSVSVDRVKIDQSFVAGLNRGHESAAIISAVIQLGHSMGLQITAEGVETTAQRDFLVEAGADELQGYLYARPLNEEQLRSWMAQQTAGEVGRLAA